MTDLKTIQKKLGIIIFSSGTLMCTVNFFTLFKRVNFTSAIFNPAVLPLFTISSIVLAVSFIDRKWARLLQVIVVSITGSIAILDVYDSIHGIGLIVMAAFIGFKYGFFKRFPVWKTVLTIVLTAALVEYSARTASLEDKILYSLATIIYMAVFTVVSYLIYSDEINSYIAENRNIRDKVKKLESKSRILAEKKAEVDEELKRLTTPVDLDAMGITPAEERVLEALVIYGETEKKLAERLNLSIHTVKCHLRSVRDKLGVDRREEILEICRNNYRRVK